nr:hypothetical protein [Nocardioides sp. InS609-2]
MTDTIELVDGDGYPTDEATDLIRSWTGSPRVLVDDLLGPIFEGYGSLTVTRVTDDYDQPARRVRLATGGWSGCEDAIGDLKRTWFWFGWWESSRRGGAYEFVVPEKSWDEPMMAFPQTSGGPLDDTAAVAEFMHAFGQEVRSTPTTDITPDERALRARLVLEEALEFVEAMGCDATVDDVDVTKDSVTVEINRDVETDLVEATDALADLNVVGKGSALTLGIPVDDAFRIVHRTNMAKLGPDGEPIRRDDGKVQKPEGWQPPTQALRDLLLERGWAG